MINLPRVSYFVEIVETGSISAAAARLRISQPALSRQLAALEREVGVQLFERAGRGIALTAAGSRFATEARSLVRHADRLDQAGRELRTGRPTTLTVAAPHSTITEVIAPCLATLEPDEQLVTARIVPGLASISEALDSADLVVGSGPPEAGLLTCTLGNAPVCAQVAPDHRWARSGVDQIDVAELAGESLIVQTPDNRSRALLDTVLGERGIATRIIASSELETIVQSLAAAGHGVGVLTERPNYRVHAVRLFDRGHPLEVVMRASWHADHYAAVAIQRLATRFAQHMEAATIRIAQSQGWL